jgi:hypothetical protein
MRFFVILFGALGVLASFLLMTRLWGLSQPILEYPNPFFEASGSSATRQGAQELTTSEPGSTAETSAHTPLWIQAWDEAPAAD